MSRTPIKIAICRNDEIFHHSGTWITEWISFCEEEKLNYEIVDCYKPDIIGKLKDFDLLLWHFSNYVLADMMVGRSILFSASNMGLKIFPDFNTSWHFDDKISETYCLQSAGAPLPSSWMFYLKNDCLDWLRNEAKYPLIAKLRCGSGSNNVKMLGSAQEAVTYSSKMFGKGLKTQPDLMFKTKSQVLSTRSWKTLKSRYKRIPEFLRTLSRAKMFPKERGYVFFQEFVPNDGYDLKIVVIGDKLSFICRNIRKGDYRASGGGDLFYDMKLVTQDIIKSAFKMNDKLGFQCMGYDYVVDKNTGTGKIVEISYGFSHTALLASGGYFDRNGVWHNEPLNAPREVIREILKKL